MKPEMQELLKKELLLLARAAQIVSHSYERCRDIDSLSDHTLEELDHLEGLTSRFARLSDLLIQKIFRLIETLDLDSPGTVRDRIHRAEKKGLIASADIFVEIRDLRNHIAHAYHVAELENIYRHVKKWTPALLESVERTNDYCKRYLDS